MTRAEQLIDAATKAAIDCKEEYNGDYAAYLAGSLKSKIKDVCEDLEKLATDRLRVAWVLVETLLENHHKDLSEEEAEAIDDLLYELRQIMGGPDKIHLAYDCYKRNPEILDEAA